MAIRVVVALVVILYTRRCFHRNPTRSVFACNSGKVAAHECINSSHSCLACELGRWAIPGDSQCLPLSLIMKFLQAVLPYEEGKFTSGTGKTVCEECSPGTYNPNTMQTVCASCAPGSIFKRWFEWMYFLQVWFL